MYLPILHLPKVELRCKLQEKLHRVTGPLLSVHSQKRHRLVATCQQVTTNLSTSSSCNKSTKMRLIATCRLQTCYTFLKLLAASLGITSFDNQLETSLLTTCNRLVVNKLSQDMRTHPDIDLLITSLLQDVNWRVASFSCLIVSVLQRALLAIEALKY